jgi:hypothetical protein
MKRKVNIKEALNAALVSLVGKHLVKQWWKTPNKAFGGKTPISMWKGTTADQTEVNLYLIKAVMQEGS